MERLNVFDPDEQTGYPSVVAGLAREQQTGNLRLKLRMEACSAKQLTDERYRYPKDTSHCPVLNNYCSYGRGELATSCGEEHLHVNAGRVIIEPADKRGNPVVEEENSAEVQVTA